MILGSPFTVKFGIATHDTFKEDITSLFFDALAPPLMVIHHHPTKSVTRNRPSIVFVKVQYKINGNGLAKHR
jgi:hypothetical protein